MDYPKLLIPTDNEQILLPSGEFVQIQKATPTFTVWKGDRVHDNYGGKNILEYNGQPAFAELIVLKNFLIEGWTGVWVDTFRSRYLTDYWPAKEVKLVREADELLKSIYQDASSRKGCWDVFCWKDNSFIFIECKAKGKDVIRGSQIKWLASAIKIGLPLSFFLIVEWSVPNEQVAI
jgi:hypothetical protein